MDGAVRDASWLYYLSFQICNRTACKSLTIGKVLLTSLTRSANAGHPPNVVNCWSPCWAYRWGWWSWWWAWLCGCCQRPWWRGASDGDGAGREWRRWAELLALNTKMLYGYILCWMTGRRLHQMEGEKLMCLLSPYKVVHSSLYSLAAILSSLILNFTSNIQCKSSILHDLLHTASEALA